LGAVSAFLLVVAAVFASLLLSLKRRYDDISYYKQFTALRPLYAANTPGSADRNILQELRTVGVCDRLPDKVSDGLISEVTFEFIPASDQTA
jgi:hypothetical protein